MVGPPHTKLLSIVLDVQEFVILHARLLAILDPFHAIVFRPAETLNNHEVLRWSHSSHARVHQPHVANFLRPQATEPSVRNGRSCSRFRAGR